MAIVVYGVLILAMFAKSEGGWCVCRTDMPDPSLQKSLDYACGAGADCTPILQNGPCYNPNNIKAHCSYAVNSYYQRNGQAPTACNFSGTAILQNSDPSYSGCTYPASASAAGTSTTTPPGNGTGTTNPYGPPSYDGLGPSGNTFSTDPNGSPTIPSPAIHAIVSFFFMLLFRP